MPAFSSASDHRVGAFDSDLWGNGQQAGCPAIDLDGRAEGCINAAGNCQADYFRVSWFAGPDKASPTDRVELRPKRSGNSRGKGCSQFSLRDGTTSVRPSANTSASGRTAEIAIIRSATVKGAARPD